MLNPLIEIISSGPATKTDPNRAEKLAAFDRLLTIMDQLRENCPWDMKQTLESLRHLTIEETYELSDAIMANDLLEIKKELGDILLHLAFYARIGEEQNAFNMADVLNGLAEKLINRHPHIYGDTKAETEDEVKRNWEQIKLAEGKGEKSVLAGVPQSLPSLIKAMRVQEKARGAGFDWDNPDDVWAKVQEELGEFYEVAIADNDVEKTSDEFGDLLFSLVNFARFKNINPDEALERTNRKFIRRFTYLEDQVRAKGLALKDLTLAEMDVYWNQAKTLERKTEL
jgi:XTP/dITP diphosphohydrolase